MNKICNRCGNEIEVQRIELGLNICKYCAGLTVKKYKGSMVFDHKTAPTINIMDESAYKDWEKYNPKFGRGSGVHKMSPLHRTK